MIIGSDLDGTWTTHEEIRTEVDLIVTGRTWMDPQNIDLDQYNISVPLFFNPESVEKPDFQSIVAHKSDIIQKAKIKKFYEDQPEQADLLKILCPHCQIILVSNQ